MTAAHPADDLLGRLTGENPPPAFALLHRPEAGDGSQVDVLVGDVSEVSALADIPLSDGDGRGAHEQLVLLPYRQIAERGFACPDDGEPLLVMDIREQELLAVSELLDRVGDTTLAVRDDAFDLDDDAYADLVRRIVDEEIGSGAGANFVLKRTFTAHLPDWSPRAALTLFRRLLAGTSGAYWTFLIRAAGRTLIGASPERHITVDLGTAVMNPISGTFRHAPAGPALAEVVRFLGDSKESNELYMVLDEELKMMSRICPDGGRVIGPQLREMSHLAHTEYFIEGRCDRDVRDVLRETLFAPTVTGSPLESACRVIRTHEPEGRGYYAGVAALLGRDAEGGRRLDSAILIRTADVDDIGRLRLSVGATLVRDSDPRAEAAETRAKAAGILAALHGPAGTTGPTAFRGPGLAADPRVSRALQERNEPLAEFWRRSPSGRSLHLPHLLGRRALLIDAEDTFTAMGHTLLSALGLRVTVRRFDEPYTVEGNDLVIVGPGPGDPRDHGHAKIAHLRAETRRLLDGGVPFLSVCLGHQVLSGLLGLTLVRKDIPHQGVQRTIDLFGQSEDVYFYNTFTAVSPADAWPGPRSRPGPVRVCRDPRTGEVHALRGEGFASVQFHPASVMTRNGTAILERLVSSVLTPSADSSREREAIA
ncbi:anthranilate synthase family protein [Streptomyces luteocolor]|uniref:anthranilate synthase family protein n=1 Tax=Streptomyces luteocolor TaxID=285500 RepID=UPI00085320E8|nr:anthranilate synthase family protein [Streptomyces luteocolor]